MKLISAFSFPATFPTIFARFPSSKLRLKPIYAEHCRCQRKILVGKYFVSSFWLKNQTQMKSKSRMEKFRSKGWRGGRSDSFVTSPFEKKKEVFSKISIFFWNKTQKTNLNGTRDKTSRFHLSDIEWKITDAWRE